ncbi:NUDIX domain-containing protein [Trueperella sp.]|uniref:NUDIX domain-containing protein n=1 Tax=Trueperella sp. TaxID=2699835 RepID=UPI00261FE595|nr:NUDIX domain-containing protein [Trueperella sp.]
MRRSGDSFVECRCGQRHWGLFGAAGIMAWRPGAPRNDAGRAGTPSGREASGEPGTEGEVLMQLRVDWSHHGGTWGVPGGAIDVGESPWEGALREFFEETGIRELEPPSGRHVLAHPDWSYTTFVAKIADPGADVVANPESAALRWVKVSQLADLNLIAPFRQALPELLSYLPA